jgi:hypothetical protein
MGIFDKIFGRKARPQSKPEHAVLVRFQYGSTDLSAVFALEVGLERAISAAQVGEFDGNEIATDGRDGTLFMYGPDADALFAVVRPLLEGAPLMSGAIVTLRYGPAGSAAQELTVTLPLVHLS